MGTTLTLTLTQRLKSWSTLRNVLSDHTKKLYTCCQCKLSHYQNKYEHYRGTKDAAYVQSTYAQELSTDKNISYKEYLNLVVCMFALSNTLQK